ncbi:MAG TPA: porin family protein [Chitinophagaceae bacterium]|nr:porin family protein [Chitinophagaceae bacterium]
MKKIVLVTLTFLLFSGITLAQRSVQFGLKGGANFSTLHSDGNGNADHRTGFHAGALAHIHLGSRFALQPEVMLSAQGAEYSNNRKDKVNYINVPVLGQYMFANGLRLQTGPQVGFLTNAESKNGNVEIDFENSLKNADLSWSFGAGYLTRSGLGFDARYNLGLTDISKANGDLRNRVWQVGLFYQFR